MKYLKKFLRIPIITNICIIIMNIILTFVWGFTGTMHPIDVEDRFIDWLNKK